MQRNFENIKRAIYGGITNDLNFDFYRHTLGGEFKSTHTKRKEMLKDLNIFLDQLDIRATKQITDKLPKNLFPKWYINNQYTIDYNNHDMLDFIITPQIN